MNCPGFFFVSVKVLFSSYADFAGVCVAAATLLEYFACGAGDGTDDIVSD